MILTFFHAFLLIPVTLLGEVRATERTQIWPRACVTFHVVLHIAQLRVSLEASLALELLALTIRLLAPY